MSGRLAKVLTNTSGFVYYVSVLGITGTKTPDVAQVRSNVTRIKQAHAASGRRRFRREDGQPGAGHRRDCRCRRGRLGPRQRGARQPHPRRQGDGPHTESGARTGGRDRQGIETCRSRRGRRHELDQEFHPAQDPRFSRHPERRAGKHVGQVPGNRPDGLLSRPRGQPVRHSGLGLSHAHRAGGPAGDDFR